MGGFSITIHESSDLLQAAGHKTQMGRCAPESPLVLNMDKRGILPFETFKRCRNQVTILRRVTLPKELYGKMCFADSAIFEELVENEPFGMLHASEFEGHWNFFHLYWISSVSLIGEEAVVVIGGSAIERGVISRLWWTCG